MDIKLPQDFREFLKLLNVNGVKYLLIDIFIAKDSENARRLVKSLSDFGFETGEFSADIFTKEKSIIRMGVEPLKIEIVNFISGIEFEEAYQDKVIGEIDKIELSIISLRHLKINKKASGRYKDLNDLENLP